MAASLANSASSIDRHLEGTSAHSYSSQFPCELDDTIYEEDDAESPPNEPVTPVSGRQSQEFEHVSIENSDIFSPDRPGALPIPKSAPLLGTLSPGQYTGQAGHTSKPSAIPCIPPARSSADDSLGPSASSLLRRPSRTSSIKRTVSTFLRKRASSQFDKGMDALAVAMSETDLQDPAGRKGLSRRWSMNRNSATVRSGTPSPPSPSSLEMPNERIPSPISLPNPDQFFSKRKVRASTGFHLRSKAANLLAGNVAGDGRMAGVERRRASSFDLASTTPLPMPAAEAEAASPFPMQRQFWGMPAESGTGVKARRMSVSLPADFAVDIAELLSEFEYQHKLLGRHKHLGKGAAAKVTLMLRKGAPAELYAVKEFRGKSSSESKDDYEKKIKSEFTVAKSLHHPNIVESIRLCTNHGRWNHVMEFCSEGDLFSLVKKGFLKEADREKDRLCLFKQLIQGINYLHSNGIAHRDIKLENLLITSDSKLKITDFGVSEVFSGTHPGLREAGGQCGVNMGQVRRCSPGICGSEPYIAPEVLKKAGDYDPRALDVWSAAIVMVNLVFGAPMWLRADDGANAKRPPSPQYLALVKGWQDWDAKHQGCHMLITETDYPAVRAFDLIVNPPALRRILLQMLNPNPDRRLTIAAVLNNRWMKNVECCQLESYDDPSQLIDVSKKASLNRGGKKIYCHNHLPLREHHGHSLGKMPGSNGY